MRSLALIAILAGLAAPLPALAIEGPYSQSFSAGALTLSNLAGRVEIEVGGKDISVEVTGKKEELSSVTVGVKSGTLIIESSKRQRRIQGDVSDYAYYVLRVPSGTALTIDGLIGEAAVGDLKADLKIEAASLEAVVGDVKNASLSVSGAGDIMVGNVNGDLKVEIAGAGSIASGDANAATISIGGSGDVAIGALLRGFSAEIAGSGDIAVESVNGPVTIEVAGSGDVMIAGGRANPLTVEVFGSGDVVMEGEAVDPDITVYGSGSVTLGSYSGKLKSRGQPNVTIGSGFAEEPAL